MADQVTMKALDTFHASNVRADNLVEGDVFNINETDAKRLEAAGLAERGGKASDAVNTGTIASDRPETRDEIDAERGFEEGKAISAAPANKMAAAPENKGAQSTGTTGTAKKVRK